MLWLANMVYSIPMLIPLCLWAASFPVLMAAIQEGSAEDAIGALTGGVGIFVMCCISIYALVLSFITPAIHIQFSRFGTFASCFRLSEIFGLVSKNSGNYLTAWLVWLGGSLLIGLILTALTAIVGWIPCIGWIFAILVSGLGSAYIFAFYSHLFGQVGAQVPQA